MKRLGCKGEINMGAVILLTATLFIGASIGVFAIHTTGFLDQTSTTNAALSIQDDSRTVSVKVYDLGNYDSLEITYNNQSRTIERAGSVDFQKSTTQKDLIVIGYTENEDGVESEEVKIEHI